MSKITLKKVNINKFGTLNVIIDNDKKCTMFIAKEIGEMWGHSNIKQSISRLLDKDEFFLISPSTQLEIYNFLITNNLTSKKTRRLQLLSVNGFVKLLMNTDRLFNKYEFINHLIENRIIDSDILFIKQRKEIQFSEILIPFLNKLGYEVSTQYYINNKYRLDFYIKELNICVEYDENEHKYRKEYDTNRDVYLIKQNIETIRVNENDNYGEILADLLIKIEEIRNKKNSFVKKLENEGFCVNKIVLDINDNIKIPF